MSLPEYREQLEQAVTTLRLMHDQQLARLAETMPDCDPLDVLDAYGNPYLAPVLTAVTFGLAVLVHTAPSRYVPAEFTEFHELTEFSPEQQLDEPNVHQYGHVRQGLYRERVAEPEWTAETVAANVNRMVTNRRGNHSGVLRGMSSAVQGWAEVETNGELWLASLDDLRLDL